MINENNKKDEKYYSVKSAAKKYDCSPQLFRNLIRDRRIRYQKVGRLVRISESALEDFIIDCPTIKEQVQEIIGSHKK